jgi:peptide/nickel transport system substrate-binding protein
MEFRPIPDAQQRANALQSGDVNLILTNLAVDAARLKEDYQVVPDYNAEKTFVALNTGQPPFDNINARRALALATDRAKIVEQVAAGEPVVSDTSPFSEVSKWGGLAPDQTGYPAYDPEAAREAVAAYTAETGQPLTFTLSGLPPVEEREVLQSLQAMWREVGIEAQVETIEQTAYIIKLTQGDFQAAYYRNYAYPDPDQNHVFWSADTMGGSLILNFNQYTSETTENALRLGRLSTDFEERAAAYEKLVLDRNQAVVDLWLFNTPYALIGDENIRGLNWFRQLPFGNFMPKPYLTGMWLQR